VEHGKMVFGNVGVWHGGVWINGTRLEKRNMGRWYLD